MSEPTKETLAYIAKYYEKKTLYQTMYKKLRDRIDHLEEQIGEEHKLVQVCIQQRARIVELKKELKQFKGDEHGDRCNTRDAV